MAPIAEAFETAGYQVYTPDIRPLLKPDDLREQAIVIKKGHQGHSMVPS